MNLSASLTALTLGALVLAGCGGGTEKSPAASPTTATTAAPVAAVTTVAPPTTTATTVAVCVVDTSAADLALDQAGRAVAADQVFLDAMKTSERQAAGAIASIQLVIDNAGRDIERAQRQVDVVQADYDHAVAASAVLHGFDTAQEDVARQARRLADAKGILASWEALRTKARGDLTRAQAQAADYVQKIGSMTIQIKTDQQRVTAATTAQTQARTRCD